MWDRQLHPLLETAIKKKRLCELNAALKTHNFGIFSPNIFTYTDKTFVINGPYLL